jgi:hypothetical protein
MNIGVIDIRKLGLDVCEEMSVQCSYTWKDVRKCQDSFPESWSKAITMDDIGARALLGAGATDEDSGKRGKGYST